MYKCKDCKKQFIGGKRRDKSQVITDYIEGKQTQLQLATKYNVSERTIRRDLKGMRFVHSIAKYKEVTIQRTADGVILLFVRVTQNLSKKNGTQTCGPQTCVPIHF